MRDAVTARQAEVAGVFCIDERVVEAPAQALILTEEVARAQRVAPQVDVALVADAVDFGEAGGELRTITVRARVGCRGALRLHGGVIEAVVLGRVPVEGVVRDPHLAQRMLPGGCVGRGDRTGHGRVVIEEIAARACQRVILEHDLVDRDGIVQLADR